MSEELGKPIAYLYHDARVPEDAHPWLHSTMLVLAADRRAGLRGETPLVTLSQAEAMVAAERERWVRAASAIIQSHDASMAHMCGRWRDMGLRSVILPECSAAEVKAINELRSMARPTSQANDTPAAPA